MTVLEQMSAFFTKFCLTDSALTDKAILCVVDALECCLAGTNQDFRTLGAYEYVKSDTGPSQLFARREQVRSEQAAFYNTVTGSVSSRNDISKKGSCHPGAIVIPVVLALASEFPCSGHQMLEAVVCGYESMIRLGITLKKAKINPSFRSTALVAPFGAAFAAAKVMGLDEEQTCSAVSLSCHSAGGINNWAVEGTGEDVFQNAWGARNGIEACRLATAGIRASHSVLEGSNGLLSAFGAQEFAGELAAELGEHFHMLEVEHKPMDSCFKLQAPCQAVQKLVQQENIQPDEIQEIEIGLSEHALYHAGSDNIHISSPVQAIMSIPFGVASVILSKDCQNISWEPPYSGQLQQLMQLCHLTQRTKWTRIFPAKHGADVVITLKNGRVLQMEQPDVDCLAPKDLYRRFQTTAVRRLGKKKTEVLVEALSRLDSLEDVGLANSAMGLSQSED